MTAALRVLVAEDEPYNRKRLVRLLNEAGCQVVAELEDGPSVLEWLEKGGEVDALFLDIQMPGLTGLDVVEDLPRPFPIVFVTAYAEHAVRAFEQAVVDYLLKPVTADRLEKTLQRLRATHEPHPAQGAPPKPSGPFRYPAKAGEGIIFLDLNRTTHFTFEDGIVWAHAGEKFRTLWKSLAEAETALAGRGLIRGHRHLLIRPEAVMGVRPGEFGRLMARLAGGLELEISRGAAPALKKRLGLG
jgi:two-component system LytT family response regulator/two-component system response regulator AlgR